MAIYDTSNAAKGQAQGPVQKETQGGERKQRPTDLVPEENKAVQKKEAATNPPADDASTDGAGKEETTPTSADPEAAKKKEAEEKAKKEREAVVTAKWQGLLGDWLGGEMAKVVLENVSLDALNGYVQDGLKAGGDAIADLLKDETKPADAKQTEGVKKFADGLNGVLLGQVDKWMKSEGAQKVLAKISTWVQDNPGKVLAIVGAAVIGGAVAAWCANPSIDISVPMGLGNDWKLKAGIDLGKLKNMGYQGASIVVSNKSTKIEFGHKVEEKDGEKTNTATIGASTEQKFGDGALFKGSSNVKIAEDVITVKLDGSLKANVAGQSIEFGGSYETDGPITGKIKVGDGSEYREITGTKKGDVVTFSTKSVFAGGSVEQKTTSNTATGQDGQQTTATANVGKGQTVTMSGGSEGNKVGYQNNDVAGTGIGVNASAGQNADGQTELKAGAKYDNGTLKAQLDYTMLQGKSSLNVSGGVKKDGYMFDASLKLDEARMTELALKMGYQNPDEFKGFLLGYKRTWVAENEQYADHFDVLLEYSIGKWYGRAMGGLDIMGNQVKKTNLDLGLGYQVNKDWMLIGGVQANGAMNQQNNNALDMSYRPYIGAQYGGVGVAAYYDTQNKGAGIMLTIPFGR